MSFDADLAAALQRLNQGQFKHALKAAKSAMRKSPRSPVAPNIAGIALGRLGQHREAAIEFRKAVRLDPGFADARRNLAQSLILLGQAETARPLLERLVAADPGDGAAQYLLAQACLFAGETDPAEAAATRAIALDDGSSRALTLRALIRDRQGRQAEALEDYQAALARNPGDVEALVSVSLLLARLTRFDEALATIRRAVALAPDHPGARLRLARQLVETGDTAAAVAEYRALLKLRPDHAEALEGLAGVQDAAANRAMLPQLRAALKAAPPRSEARAALHFAEARIAAQSGQDEVARKARAAANREMARILPYDARADSALTDRLLARFTDPLPSGPVPDGTPLPVYVLGLPRSGTTLAEAIMGAHPQVAPLGERAAAGALLQAVINRDLPFDPAAAARFVAADRRLLPELPPGTRAYVDKMPENYRLIGFLRTAYPYCRIICLARDPRDVAWSIWREHFSGTALAYAYDLEAMAHRFNLYARFMAHWRGLLGDGLMEVAYEDMVADVAGTGRRMAEFCGLDWRPEMARPDLAAGPVLTASATQIRQPVHARSVGGWRAHADELAPLIAGLDPALWPVIRGDGGATA